MILLPILTAAYFLDLKQFNIKNKLIFSLYNFAKFDLKLKIFFKVKNKLLNQKCRN